MTLCIAHRKGKNNIELVSDSRISVGSKYFDTGIKVFAIPINILWPKLEDETDDDKKPTYTIGLAISGDTLHAYLVKEAVAELLQNLQYIPSHTDTSFVGICEIVLKVFKQLAQDIDGVRDKGVETGFFLTGYCTEKRQVRAFKFSTDRSMYGMIGGKYEEVLQGDSQMEFIGSGSKLGRKIHEEHPSWPSLWVMDEAIRRKEEPSVGGRPQYGCFYDQFTFYISGVIDYVLDENDVLLKKLFLRGVDLYKEEFETGNFNYLINCQQIDLFREEYINNRNRKYPNDKFVR